MPVVGQLLRLIQVVWHRALQLERIEGTLRFKVRRWKNLERSACLELGELR